MSDLAIVKEISGRIEDVCSRVTEAIKPAGFGVLTRIDFDQKIREKLGETIKPCIILGACNPKIAFEAYSQSTDVALLVPCNIVLTETGPGRVRIEAMRPTRMLDILSAVKESPSIAKAEDELKKIIEAL